MFLKSLTLKGFKSFAEHTTLDFEPGVTVVVGPNGSGKSNLVDAVAWVLGARAARPLRGSKMDDVIFAGSGTRPALGRAEVSLTIDNSAGLLPIGFTEVTITRTLFRASGESEYAINGAPCRLLDVQELLSDSGVGRTQHVIVSQGQLDSVLTARPEDRRAVVEEAAGVLKYRRRKEKAERRLAATESNLLRLQDLLREVRRQLRPLERQADAARRHGALASELAALRLHLAGREVAAFQARADAAASGKAALTSEESELRARLAELDRSVAGAEGALAATDASGLGELVGRAEALRERARGQAALLAERRRSLERDRSAFVDHTLVAALEAEAARVTGELAEVESSGRELVPEADGLTTAEAELAAETEHRALVARVEALTLALEAATPASAQGALGLLFQLVDVDPGWEAAVAAAVGDSLNALVVGDEDAARAVLSSLAAAGAAGTVVAAGARQAAPVSLSVRGAEPVRHHVRGREPAVVRALDFLLAGAVLVDGGWEHALDAALAHPQLVVVTRAGDRFGGGTWRLGASRTSVTVAALDDARERADHAAAVLAEETARAG